MNKKFGLLGYPLGHSVSDYIHRRIFELCGVTDFEYNLYEVSPDELSLKSGLMKELQGFNVTIPYKTAIIPFLDRLDETAAGYGSVNCVNYNEEFNEYVGYNTDGYGFLKAIEVLGASLKGAKVLLLGCGGTGRMMAFESIKAGAELTVAIRREATEEKAAAKLSQDIVGSDGSGLKNKNGQFVTATIGSINTLGNTLPPARRMRITYTDTLNAVNEYDLLLNATPCGMYPNVDDIPLVPEILGKVRYLFDAIYNPTPTRLASEAKKRGVKTLNGMTMLVHQAAISEVIWNGLRISDDDSQQIIDELLNKL
ncbi:MAG: shikimate dehydrogenase [Oscillospiraceae bacterium]|nr:shikimate dehydrogenase [Oscillospiraceae bacterium]